MTDIQDKPKKKRAPRAKKQTKQEERDMVSAMYTEQENVVGIFSRGMGKYFSDNREDKTQENPTFEDLVRLNQEKKERIAAERKNDNESVINRWKLKKT